MPLVTLRAQLGISGPNDLQVEVKDATFEYLKTSTAPTIRVSSYLDRDWPEVAKSYAELFIDDQVPFVSRIAGVIAGSRVRKGVQLPGPMHKDEQLTLEVKRQPK